MTVLLIAASPSQHSRSAALLAHAGRRLERAGQSIQRLQVRELNSQALVQANFSDASIVAATEQVAQAQVLIVATPVYKAAYSGVLKVFLDLLSQTALKGKTVLPLATGGSPHHMLALDYALRPVLQSLGAKHILPGIYATDAQVTLTPEGGSTLAPELAQRVDDAVHLLLTETLPPSLPAAASSYFAPIAFSQVRCSV